MRCVEKVVLKNGGGAELSSRSIEAWRACESCDVSERRLLRLDMAAELLKSWVLEMSPSRRSSACSGGREEWRVIGCNNASLPAL